MGVEQDSHSYAILGELGIPSNLYDEAQKHYLTEDFAHAFELTRRVIEDVLSRSDCGAGGDRSKRGTARKTSLRDVAILAASSLYRQDRFKRCREFLHQCRARSLLDEDDPMAALIELWILCQEGRYAEVRTAAKSFCGAPPNQALTPLTAEYLYLLGTVENHLGHATSGLQALQHAIAIFALHGCRREEAEVANSLGMAYVQAGRYLEGQDAYERSLRINEELGLRGRVGQNFADIGLCLSKQGQYQRSLAYLDRAWELYRSPDAKTALCRIIISRGNVHRLLGEYDKARSELMSAYRLATELHLRREECLTLEGLGDVMRDEGHAESARRYYGRALMIAKAIAPEGDLVTGLLRRDGECLVLLSQPDEAVSLLERALQQARLQSDCFEKGVIRRCLAGAWASLSKWERSIGCLIEAEQILSRARARHEQSLCSLTAARVYLAAARQAKGEAAKRLLNTAWEKGLTAQYQFQELGLSRAVSEAQDLLEQILKSKTGIARQSGRDGAEPKNAIRPVSRGNIEIIAESPGMLALIEHATLVAAFDDPVLILGETGTGKELIARLIHAKSARWTGEFVAVNCAAIPETLFEREFFGHHRGAYSGADHDMPGLIAKADGGTLFLDELSEMPITAQSKLLRLIQEGSYRCLGDPQERTCDIRLVAATNQDLRMLVAQSRFRADLYYRLRIVELEIPPLRKRPEDIVPLLKHFVSLHHTQKATLHDFFSPAQIANFREQQWPGNVRELETLARRAIIQASSCKSTANVCHLYRFFPTVQTASHEPVNSADTDISKLVELLGETKGNKAEAARRLGISRPTLYRRLRRIGL